MTTVPAHASPKHSQVTDSPGHDIDPIETSEWLESLSAVVDCSGSAHGPTCCISLLNTRATCVSPPERRHIQRIAMPFRSTIHPGDVALEERLTALMRWNTLAVVMRANKA